MQRWVSKFKDAEYRVTLGKKMLKQALIGLAILEALNYLVSKL